MTHLPSLQDIKDLQADLATGWGIPMSWYTSEEHSDFEMEQVFSKSWLFFAPIHKLAEPGDTVVGHAGKVPVVVTRGKDGELRGFVNLCRHRGHAVATKSGKCNVLTCRYHAWTYNLDGTLRGAPHTREEPGFDKSEMSLLPISVNAWGAGVYVHLDPNAPSLLEAHPKLQAHATSMNVETDPDHYLRNFELVREVTYEFESNWKLWYDNNTECYHCPTIHSETFGEAFDTDGDNMRFDRVDRFMSYSFDAKEEEVKDDDKLRASWQKAIQIFPAIGISMQEEFVIIYQTLPTGPESARKVMYCLANKSVDREHALRWIELWYRTFQEDQDVTSVQQAGIRCGQLPRARYVTNQEHPVVFVNELILDVYEKALK